MLIGLPSNFSFKSTRKAQATCSLLTASHHVLACKIPDNDLFSDEFKLAAM